MPKKKTKMREVGDASEQNSLLVWLPGIKKFMSVQPGIGDNLEPGYDDYFLYTILKPETVDLCDELTLEAVDGGQWDIEKGHPYTEDVIGDILEFHFDRKMEYVILLSEKDLLD